MKRMTTRIGLVAAVVWFLAAGAGMATAIGAGHHGTAAVAADTWQVLQSAHATMAAPGGGAVDLELRRLAPAGHLDRAVTTLAAEARGLTPSTRILLLVDGRQLGELQADRSGRAALRVASGSYEAGWLPVAPDALGRNALSVVQLVEAGSGRSEGGVLYSRTAGNDSGDGEVYADWTPLCGQNDPSVFGGAGVYRDETIQVLDVFAAGLQAGAPYGVVVDGNDLGTYAADDEGLIALEFTTDPDGTGSLPLPDALVPVDGIDVVQFVADGAAVLAGSFRQPCELQMPEPTEWGGFDLCPPEDASSMAWGFFGWTIWDDGHQEAVVGAEGLAPGAEATVLFDGTPVGTATADEAGSLWICLSTDPCCGALPLPDGVLPVSAVRHVVIEVAGESVLAGTEGEPCNGGWEPPIPADSDQTPLCAVEDGSFAGGVAGWDVWENGDEDLWVVAYGLEPGTAYTVTIDGTTFDVNADDWGGFELVLSSDPAIFGGDPLPAALQPVSGTDSIAVAAAGGDVLQGSFSEPCDPCGGWEPPVPADGDMTTLCPDEGGSGGGMAAWAVYDDPQGEAFAVAVGGLTPDLEYELRIDGRAVGSYIAASDGSLVLDFCTDPDALGCSTPMPDGVGPVADIDVVELVAADGSPGVHGSFSEPCDAGGGWEPPTPVDMDQTPMCSPEGSMAMGVVGWTVFEDPDGEAFGLFAEGLEPGQVYQLVVDGAIAGTWPADSWGGLMIDMCSDPDALGCSEALPGSMSPVSGIDTVALVDPTGNTVLAGSFSDPCDPSGGGGGGYDGTADSTGLCDVGTGVEVGQAGWYRAVDSDGNLVEEGIGVVYVPLSGEGVYTVVIDGIEAGTIDASWGAGELTLSSTGNPNPLPGALSPVDRIDSVQILDTDGGVVAEGSFSNPCSGGAMPMALRHGTPSLRTGGPATVRGIIGTTY